jgi:hypothetical protein
MSWKSIALTLDEDALSDSHSGLFKSGDAATPRLIGGWMGFQDRPRRGGEETIPVLAGIS